MKKAIKKPVKISGEVIKGREYGRKIGYPTVNIEVKAEELPEVGVYAGWGTIQNQTHRAGIVVSPEGKLEAHLIGYKGNAYGSIVTLEIEKFLREFKNFETEEELIEQIKKDLKECLPA